MSDQWLCLIDGQKFGPLKFTRLQQLAETGRLKPDDYVRPASDEQWQAAKDIPNLIPAPPVTHDRAETAAVSKRRSPASLPVAQAIIEPEAPKSAIDIPRGKTVASPPPVPPPDPSEQFAVNGLPYVVTDPKASHEPILPTLRGRHRKNNAMPLMIGGVAIVGVLAVVLVLVLSGVIDVSGSATPVAKADTQNKPTLPEMPENNFDDEEANPDGAAATENVDAQPKREAVKKNAMLASVRQFLDITKRYRLNSKLPVQVSVTGLWLSADELGQPYVAAENGAASKAPKFLVIKLQIENAPGAAPLEYAGWNKAAILFDGDDQAIEPLGKPAEENANRRIEPGGSLIDTLVFPLASVEFDKLRLVLPHATVGIKGSKSFGLELPRDALGHGLSTELANVVDASVKARVLSSDEPGKIIDKDASPMPQPKPTAGKAKADDDDLGLNKLKAKADERDKMEQKK